VVSVIVTIYSSSSYDDLFRSVPQISSEGRIRLYSLDLHSIGHLLKLFNGQNLDGIDPQNAETAKELIKDIQEVDPDCVLFNFECCEGCNDGHIRTKPKCDDVMGMTKYCLDKGYMIMFSDFAVMMLLSIWNESLIGSNPFIQTDTCSGQIKLEFDPNVLKESPSKQLQMVGNLGDKGYAHVETLGGTIVISYNPEKVSDQYKCSLLTYVTEMSAEGYDYNGKDYSIDYKGKKANVGHALLEYPSGGIIIISAAHWVELCNIGVNMDNLKNVAKCEYGAMYDEEINSIECEKEESVRVSKMNKLANKFVQQTVSCKTKKK
jgi:hypothetical protein